MTSGQFKNRVARMDASADASNRDAAGSAGRRCPPNAARNELTSEVAIALPAGYHSLHRSVADVTGR
jgi:hypothetical protein